MPAVSRKQQRFMGMCAHTDHPPESCPSRSVAREFAHKGKTLLTGRRKRRAR